jgi:hypothetical protein
MGHVQHHVEQLVIPVAGAFNCGHERLSTAAPHLRSLRRRLETDGDRVVTQPIVPSGFGVLRSLDRTYRDYIEEVERRAERYPNAEIVLVGHSLGGLLARKQASEHLGRLRGIVTLASPHDGVKPESLVVPPSIKREYRRFAQSITSTDVPTLFIGSARDEIVSINSALPPVDGAETHEISWYGPVPLLHNLVPLAPSVTAPTARSVDRMFGMTAPATMVEQLDSLPRPA